MIMIFEQLNEKIKSKMEPYAQEFRNIGFNLTLINNIEKPALSNYYMQTVDGVFFGEIGIQIPEDFSKSSVFFVIYTNITEKISTTFNKHDKVKTEIYYELCDSSVFFEDEFKKVLNWSKYIIKKIKEIKQHNKFNEIEGDFYELEL